MMVVLTYLLDRPSRRDKVLAKFLGRHTLLYLGNGRHKHGQRGGRSSQRVDKAPLTAAVVVAVLGALRLPVLPAVTPVSVMVIVAAMVVVTMTRS